MPKITVMNSSKEWGSWLEREIKQFAAKNKEGILKTAPEEVLKCWEEHFCTHLNTQFPRDENVLQSIPDPPNTDAGSEPFTLAEVEVAVKSLKNNKAGQNCCWNLEGRRSSNEAAATKNHQRGMDRGKNAWRLEQRPHDPSFQEGRQTQSKQLQSNHLTLHTRESILQDDP